MSLDAQSLSVVVCARTVLLALVSGYFAFIF